MIYDQKQNIMKKLNKKTKEIQTVDVIDDR